MANIEQIAFMLAVLLLVVTVSGSVWALWSFDLVGQAEKKLIEKIKNDKGFQKEVHDIAKKARDDGVEPNYVDLLESLLDSLPKGESSRITGLHQTSMQGRLDYANSLIERSNILATNALRDSAIGAPIRIFIAEDSPDIRSDVEGIVKRVYVDAKIQKADSYQKALEAINGACFDVMIVDLALSGDTDKYKWEGYDVAKKGIEKNKDVAIIILSGHLSAKDYQNISADEILRYEFIEKGVNWVARLEYTLKRQKNKEELRRFPEILWPVRTESYWILLLESGENKEGNEIYAKLRAFSDKYVGKEANIHYSWPGLVYHKEMEEHFGNFGFPSLLISKTSTFEKYVVCKPDILLKLLGEHPGLVEFYKELHSQLSTREFSEIERDIKSMPFWDKLVKNASEFATLSERYIAFSEKYF